MLGYVDATPGAQNYPAGAGAVLGDVVAESEANEDRGDFLAYLADGAAAGFGARLRTWGGQGDLKVFGQADDAFLSGPFTADTRRSDHASFWAVGVPAVMLTDTANFRNPHYHCSGGPDAAVDLDPAFLTASVRASVGAIADALDGGR